MAAAVVAAVSYSDDSIAYSLFISTRYLSRDNGDIKFAVCVSARNTSLSTK